MIKVYLLGSYLVPKKSLFGDYFTYKNFFLDEEEKVEKLKKVQNSVFWWEKGKFWGKYGEKERMEIRILIFDNFFGRHDQNKYKRVVLLPNG